MLRFLCDPMEIGKGFLDDVEKDARLTWSYLVLMSASGALAAIAFLANSVPLLIGAMVVAPAYGPLSLTAFAICAGDARLTLRGLSTAFIGISVAVMVAAAVTLILNATGVIPVESNLIHKPLLEERIRPGWYSVVVGIVAGIAGAVATIQNKKDILVGVVAAVALIPAGSASAVVLVSNGDLLRALGGFALLFVNFGLIVGMGVFTALFMESRLFGPRERDGMD